MNKLCLISFLLFIQLNVFSQNEAMFSGPANMDTSKFAHVYFLRDKPDKLKKNWVGVMMNTDQAISVKAEVNSIYRINTLAKGETWFWTSIYGNREEVRMIISPGQNYYIEINPTDKSDELLSSNIKVLEENEALERINKFTDKIKEHYCSIPYPGNNDFVDNLYQDTVRWYASKKLDYFFTPLPGWEIILRSPEKTAFGFRNKLISATYSLVGGVLYDSLSQCRSQEDFNTYSKGVFINSTIYSSRDSIISIERKEIAIPGGIKYACLINTVLKSSTKEFDELHINSSYIVFYWEDSKGVGSTASLYNSERGLPEELHSLQILESNLLASWSGFRLSTKK